ncbi:MAG TPA: hypothetical protein VJJ02_04510 [Candidatus Paceibacterota bacterium]
MMLNYAALEQTMFSKKEKRGYVNREPLTDPMEVLGLLYTHPLANDRPTKHLMPYPILGPLPRGIALENNLHTPFIEWSWVDEVCGLSPDAEDCLVDVKVVDGLIREGWVEETPRVNVFKISLLGIAIYAAWRKKMSEQETASTSALSSD